MGRSLAIIGIILAVVGLVLYVTKVLMWGGLIMVIVGAILFYSSWWKYRKSRQAGDKSCVLNPKKGGK